MVKSTNAAPFVLFDGINDASRKALPPATESTPQHYPLIRLFTESGTTRTTPISTIADFNRIYGEKTFNVRSPFFNMQALLARIVLSQGNAIMVKRLVPSDAGNPARLVLGIDIVKDKVVDPSNPASIASDPKSPRIDGVRARIVVIKDNVNPVGQLQPYAGGIVAADGTQSKTYPLLELPVDSVGAKGNLTGLRIWAPTTNDEQGPDLHAAEAFKTRMLRLQLVKKDSESSAPRIIYTTKDNPYIDVSLTEGTYNDTTNVDYYAPDVLKAEYSDRNGDTAPVFSPFSDLVIHHDNLSLVQNLIRDAVIAADPTAAAALPGPDAVDVFTGQDLQGHAYKGYALEGFISGGINLGRDYTVYASGGADGTINTKVYNDMIIAHNSSFGSGEEDLTNKAVYPFSVVYDTGLSMEGKFSQINLLSARPDIRIVFTTWIEGEERGLTVNEELSRGTAIRAHLSSNPESTVYNTPVCRGDVIHLTGKLISSDYRKRTPYIIDYANGWAKMAGAASGVMSAQAQMDIAPNNEVTLLRDPNIENVKPNLATQLWGAGGTWAQYSDRRTMYYPALHSVYNDDTSVLTSPITVHIACDIIRRIFKLHKDFSGNSAWTNEQFIQRCDEKATEMLSGLYGGRVRIAVRTVMTAADLQRGYSWTVKVSLFSNNMRNLMNFELSTARLSDLANDKDLSARSFGS